MWCTKSSFGSSSSHAGGDDDDGVGRFRIITQFPRTGA